MTDEHAAPLFNPKVDFAVQTAGGLFPKSLEDLNASHNDPTYELVSGAREAYFIKKIAGMLSRKFAQSEDVRNLSHLVQDSARELERNWRMAACISNVPVSTGYPYLPMMPAAPSVPSVDAAAGPQAGAASTVDQSATAGSSRLTTPEAAATVKKAALDDIFLLIVHGKPLRNQSQSRLRQLKAFI